jgi:hypothetical protein
MGGLGMTVSDVAVSLEYEEGPVAYCPRGRHRADLAGSLPLAQDPTSDQRIQSSGRVERAFAL